MTIENQQTILIVEDSTLLWSSMKRALRQSHPHAQVFCLGSYEEAVEYLEQNRPNLIICDFYLPNLRTGIELWEHRFVRFSRPPFLLMSGMGTEVFLSIMKDKKVCPLFLSKPFSLDQLSVLVHQMIEPSVGRKAA